MERKRDQPESRTARLFMNGRSQAVRLPQEFRLPGKAVRIRKEGEAVILEPIKPRGWPAGYWRRIERLRRQADLESLERLPDPPPPPVAGFDPAS